MNEVVKYGNVINSLNFSKFSQVEMNLFFALCGKSIDKGCNRIEIDYSELRKITHFRGRSTKTLADNLDKMYGKMSQITGRFRNGNTRTQFTMFITWENNPDTETLGIKVHPDYEYLLNNLQKEFTKFGLEEFVGLDSKYSKTLYRMLKQFKTTGRMIINDVDEFREKMGCPASYKNGIFMRDIVMPAVEELKEVFVNLECSPIYATNKRGKPLDGILFTFQKEVSLLKEPKKEVRPEPPKEAETKKEPAAKKKATGGKPNRFHNYEQRDTDYDSLLDQYDPLRK